MRNKDREFYEGLAKISRVGFQEDNINLFTEIYRDFDYTDKADNSILHILAKIYLKVKDEVLENSFKIAFENISPSLLISLNINRNTFLHELLLNKKINFPVKEYVFKTLTSTFRKNGVFLMSVVNNSGENLLDLLVKNANNEYEVRKLLYYFETLNFDFIKYANNEEDLRRCINTNSNYSANDKIKIFRDIIEIKNKKISKNNSSLRKLEKKQSIQEDYDEEDYEEESQGQAKKITNLGSVLTKKIFINAPAIGRDKEIKQLIVSLASNKKVPLLVGPSGCGKTAIVEQLAYLIQNDMVPNFLKSTPIFETSTSRILAGTSYRGTMEENMLTILNYIKKKKAILFIDEIHNIFEAGATDADRHSDISSILKEFIDRENIKVIGVTTDTEYKENMANNSLKRRFDLIKIAEPSEIVLESILYNYIINTSEERNIEVNNLSSKIKQIIEIIIEITKKEHRRQDDDMNNPDLAISILDNSFAYAVCSNNNELEIDNIISSIEGSNRIYGFARGIAINNIKALKNSKDIKPKGLIINLSDYRK